MKKSTTEWRSPMAVACGTEIPFGRLKGKTIARVGASDAGLARLRLLRQAATAGRDHPGFFEQLEVYLAEPSIARRLETMDSDFDSGDRS
jgi:hypothetical protein